MTKPMHLYSPVVGNIWKFIYTNQVADEYSITLRDAKDGLRYNHIASLSSNGEKFIEITGVNETDGDPIIWKAIAESAVKEIVLRNHKRFADQHGHSTAAFAYSKRC